MNTTTRLMVAALAAAGISCLPTMTALTEEPATGKSGEKTPAVQEQPASECAQPAEQPSPVQEPSPPPQPAEPPAPEPQDRIMTPEEVRTMVDATIERNKDLREVIKDMSGYMSPDVKIERGPDATYPYYDVYVGTQEGEHAWRLFTFIIDPKAGTLRVVCTDIAGFDGGTVDDFVSAYRSCGKLNPSGRAK